MKLLIIEDDPRIQEIISVYCEMIWPEVKVVPSFQGKRGLELSESEKPDVIILDLGLPDMDGMEVLKEIRSSSDVPVIILTVRSEETDKVKGLEFGADDYMVKPFSPAELLARVRAVLRRTEAPPLEGEPLISFGELTIDPTGKKVTLGGRKIRLTPTEYDLLYHLAQNAGKTLTHEFLLSRIWGEECINSPGRLKVYIRKLRVKMEKDPRNPQLILTRKRGYLLTR
jgi:two-component system KDP operon response regulator KdpE